MFFSSSSRLTEGKKFQISSGTLHDTPSRLCIPVVCGTRQADGLADDEGSLDGTRIEVGTAGEIGRDVEMDSVEEVLLEICSQVSKVAPYARPG